MNINSVSIEEEFRKNPKSLKKADIEEVKKWCKENHYLPMSKSSSDVAIFLHSNYYFEEATMLNIENYYRTRNSMPEIFAKRDVFSDELKTIFDTVAMIPLEKRTREGYKVILIRRLEVVKNKNISSIDVIKAFNMVLDAIIYEEGTIEGYIVIVDLNGIEASIGDSFDTPLVKEYCKYLRKVAPIRWFGLHFINSALPFEMIHRYHSRMSIVQNKYIDTMYLHMDIDSLNEVVPLDHLPHDLAGRAGSLKALHAAQVEKLRRKSIWFYTMECNEAFSKSMRKLLALLSKAEID